MQVAKFILNATAVIFAIALLPGEALVSETNSNSQRQGSEKTAGIPISMAGSPFGIAAGFLYGYQGTPAFGFMRELRKLGADFTKVYFFWNQIEPTKGHYDWTAVDRFVGQLKSPEEGLISVFSSSQWATKQSSAILPPSAAKNPDDYYRLVFDLVKHCGGRVRYWQNDAEPNSPIYWGGSKEEFVAQLKIFYQAVKDADATATVVVGGYDGLFGPPGTHQFPNQQAGLDFFDYVLKEGRAAFDVFDLRLYGDPYTIPARVQFMREKMLALGYDKPIICTEYGGPNLFEFPENRKYVPLVASWTQAVATADEKGATGSGDAAKPLQQLYEGMATLAPQTQMFMEGCSPELEAKYQRIQARGLVMRNIFAFSAGVQKNVYWDLPRPQVSSDGRYHIMALMYGKIGLMEFRDGELKKRYATADAYERMANALRGVRWVKRVLISGKPTVFLFEVDRGKRGSEYVVWEQRDAFSGEDLPATPVEIPWNGKPATATDALGTTVKVDVKDRTLSLPVSLTPIFIEQAGE
jgi:hypothetical protein